MTGFSNLLQNGREFTNVKTALQSHALPMGVLGLSAVHKAHYIAALCETLGKPALVLCPDEGAATRLCEDLNTFAGAAVLYPARDIHLRSTESASREYEQQRIGALCNTLNGTCRFLVCSIEAASQRTLPRQELRRRSLHLTVGAEIAPADVIAVLLSAGYVRAEQVEGVGQFSLRGGILDLSPPHLSHPLRVEFWGDTVDSISALTPRPSGAPSKWTTCGSPRRRRCCLTATTRCCKS